MPACLVYITAASAEEATRIGRTVVEERLAACVNVHSPITSIYRWQDAIQQDSETVLIAKTPDRLIDRLVERVVELHSYDCPCIVAVPVVGGHRPFLDWIDAETEISE